MNDYSNDDSFHNNSNNNHSLMNHHYGNSVALLNNSSNLKKGGQHQEDTGGRNTKMESRIESSADFVDYMIPLSSLGGGVKKQNANVNLGS